MPVLFHHTCPLNCLCQHRPVCDCTAEAKSHLRNALKSVGLCFGPPKAFGVSSHWISFVGGKGTPLLINEGLYLIQVGLKLRCCLCPFFAKGQQSSIVDGISEVFQSLSCTCIGWAGQSLLKHSDEILHFLWFTGHTCVDMMSAFFLGMMRPLGLEIHIAADKGVVSVTVCTLVTTN